MTFGEVLNLREPLSVYMSQHGVGASLEGVNCLPQSFNDCLNDDLNMPKALALVWK